MTPVFALSRGGACGASPKSVWIRRAPAHRRGSALLLCTLAAVVLSLSAIAILRSHQRELRQTEALSTSLRGRVTADGLMQRSVAQLRAIPAFDGAVTDPDAMIPDAFAQITRLNSAQTRVEVFLYPGSVIPAASRIVNPNSL